MINTTADIREIPVFASMWNMDGLILMGFCEADYEKLRNQMRISFVVYDGYFEKCSKVVNLVIDHFDGGFQAGDISNNLDIKRHCASRIILSVWIKSVSKVLVKPLRREKWWSG